MREELLREIVADRLRAGFTTSEIRKSLGVNRMLIKRVRDMLSARGNVKSLPKGSPPLKRSLDVVRQVRDSVNNNPKQSIRKLAKEFAKKYVELLETKVKPWLDTAYLNGNYVFTQDGALAPTSNLTQNWLEENFQEFWSKHFWPPSSLDIYPLDFSI